LLDYLQENPKGLGTLVESIRGEKNTELSDTEDYRWSTETPKYKTRTSQR
jgi:hypothetical protein